MGHRGRWVLGVAWLAALAGSAPAADQVVRVGALVTRGVERCVAEWTPLVEYLSASVEGYTFRLVPVGYSSLRETLAGKKVDYLIGNPLAHVEAELIRGARPLATIRRAGPDGRARSMFGSVVFCRSDRGDIAKLEDLRGKRLAAVDALSFGGWIAAWRELQERGVDPTKGLASLVFLGTHDAVVFAVREGRADAGVVRTDALEWLAQEGTIRLGDFRALSPVTGGNGSCLRSTPWYPEWAFDQVEERSDGLSERVAVALLRMGGDHPAARAAQTSGWAIAENYRPARECMQALRIGPYKDYGRATLKEVLSRYWPELGLASALTVSLGVFAVVVARLNRRLEAAMERQRAELAERQKAEEQVAAYQLELRALASELSLAEERERRRIATELHDRISQTLNVASMKLAAAPEAGAGRERLEEVRGLVDEAIDDAQRLTFELSSPVLYQLGLEAALEWLADQARRKGNLDVTFSDDGQPKPLPEDVRVVVYQSVRELLNNVVKHAGARRATVEAGREGALVRVAVADDGKGFEAGADAPRRGGKGGFGLFSIRERMRQLGGTVRIVSRPGRGTTVVLTAPAAEGIQGASGHGGANSAGG
ncbi:MAG TPA: PhnD/SsuA/transferrin family substrate-binding protein [Candidatus Brocadiia bacterium]|nr:PhnD/SsuA/transferrin family substrate-binding protein [Candidatus Brocadiia bacterium]